MQFLPLDGGEEEGDKLKGDDETTEAETKKSVEGNHGLFIFKYSVLLLRSVLFG